MNREVEVRVMKKALEVLGSLDAQDLDDLKEGFALFHEQRDGKAIKCTASIPQRRSKEFSYAVCAFALKAIPDSERRLVLLKLALDLMRDDQGD